MIVSSGPHQAIEDQQEAMTVALLPPSLFCHGHLDLRRCLGCTFNSQWTCVRVSSGPRQAIEDQQEAMTVALRPPSLFSHGRLDSNYGCTFNSQLDRNGR